MSSAIPLMTETSEAPSVLESFVQRASTLYSPPSIAMRVLELTASPKVDTRALKECIENDPAMVSKLLRVVNSSMFGLSRKVSDLNQALALLGIKPLKLLVLGFSLPRDLFSSLDSDVLDRYWRRTLTRAVAARLLSEELWNCPGDDAFVAGLLQDLGMLVMLQELGPSYSEFVRKVEQRGQSLVEAELSALGFDHAILSAKVMKQWSFPDEVAEAVAAAHNLDEVHRLPPSSQTLGQILHLADLIAELLSGHCDSKLLTILERGDLFAGMTQQQLEVIVQRLEERVATLADIYSLHLNDVEMADSIVHRAHQQMASLAEAAASDLVASEEMLLDESRQLAAAVRRFAHHFDQNDGSSIPIDLSNEERGGETISPHAHKPTSLSGIDATLRKSVSAAIADCRTLRCPVSLLAVGIDQHGEVQDPPCGDISPVDAKRIIQSVSDAAPAGSIITPISDSAIAIILFKHNREDAIGVAREILSAVRRLSQVQSTDDNESDAQTISVGVASLAQVPKNDPAEALIDAANRCLYAAQAANGDSLKSFSL